MCDTLMMTMDFNCSRKRLRSADGEEDGPFALQRKMFISQQRIDQQDQRKMRQIEQKTLNMLFLGAKTNQKLTQTCQRECLRHVRLLGGGECQFDTHSCPAWIEKQPDRKCRVCDRMSLVHAECTNCNLELCEHCGISCGHCPDKICMSCVNLFNCQNMDIPCCERCKIFN
ncbi:uncharacterized protein LOC129749327 [Uranotaenia lowii]|uniref:uncharacterized protein LOC129749327 n=1 Tax=Uranotaenia lowii TaxID=190385 RepID=UPI00247B118A|nr:uncharacterized protein LOC129749327 [Uranotaenia lowii]